MTSRSNEISLILVVYLTTKRLQINIDDSLISKLIRTKDEEKSSTSLSTVQLQEALMYNEIKFKIFYWKFFKSVIITFRPKLSVFIRLLEIFVTSACFKLTDEERLVGLVPKYGTVWKRSSPFLFKEGVLIRSQMTSFIPLLCHCSSLSRMKMFSIPIG